MEEKKNKEFTDLRVDREVNTACENGEEKKTGYSIRKFRYVGGTSDTDEKR